MAIKLPDIKFFRILILYIYLIFCQFVGFVLNSSSFLFANQTAGFRETLTEVEILALIVGCVCHDLDHRGTNNAFQAK